MNNIHQMVQDLTVNAQAAADSTQNSIASFSLNNTDRISVDHTFVDNAAASTHFQPSRLDEYR